MTEVVKIRYRNHRGVVSERAIQPYWLYYGECEWHDGEQWLLYAWDADKAAYRTFALRDVLEWAGVEVTP